MPRADHHGMFWYDEPKVKAAPKEKIKREPPHPFWLEPDYLPNLAEARAFNMPLFTDAELVIAAAKKERLVFDIECYPNYVLLAFKSITSGKFVYFETDGDMNLIDLPKLRWLLRSFTLVTFNGMKYDMPITAIALTGAGPDAMWWATEQMIKFDRRPHEVLKVMKVKQLKEIDHIDILEVAPLHDSLKIYAGRLHTKRMQDLPFKPGTMLTDEQKLITRWYCCNDLQSTEELHNHLIPALNLRQNMSREYGTDLRSKSDAQVAEGVITSGIGKLTGQKRFPDPKIEPGKSFKYKIPHYIKYQSPLLNWVLDRVRNADFVIGLDGYVQQPTGFPLEFKIANTEYTVGIGGIHSKEKKVTHRAGEDWLLIDRDVASFYPRVILTQRLYPEALGEAFLRVYETIVTRRLAAKAKVSLLKEEYKGQKMPAAVASTVAEMTITMDSLKLTINGSFGKFGNPYSILYSPNLMIQVTLTGQLVLLMLIERLELAGISVVSANTDGILIKCHKKDKERLDAIVKQWETDIDCETEETLYTSIHNRDVNSYFAIKPDGEIKVKGAYAEKGSAGNSVLSKNPYALIASDAVKQFLLKGTPIDHTIRECKDIRRFVCVKNVKKGAVKIYDDGTPNEYLGKAVRWYYSTTVTGEIVNSVNGNKVGTSDNARPCMLLPEVIPEDLNYDWYIEKANTILEEIGI